MSEWRLPAVLVRILLPNRDASIVMHRSKLGARSQLNPVDVTKGMLWKICLSLHNYTCCIR
jgi:hypothetical protein